MSALHLLSELQSNKVRVWIESGCLELEAPAGVLTDELRSELRRLKPELLELLAQIDKAQSEVLSTRNTGDAVTVSALYNPALAYAYANRLFRCGEIDATQRDYLQGVALSK
jgi:hypothetical protein